MKKMIILMILALSVSTMFTACEKNDYQHPAHRK